MLDDPAGVDAHVVRDHVRGDPDAARSRALLDGFERRLAAEVVNRIQTARKEADLTFRVLLILKYQWERQIRMLDRRDDGYTI